MYTKALWPGRRSPLPALIVTTRQPHLLHPHLQASGWARFGQPRPLNPTGQLVITHHRLQLLVNGTTLADGINPTSPPGWWQAVDHSDGLCAVLVVEDHHINLPTPANGSSLTVTLNTDRALFAALPVLT